MSYIETFIAPVPTDKRDAYLDSARKAAAVFKEYGVSKVTECWGTNVPDGQITSFPLSVKLEEGESIVFAWMEWPSRDARDAAWEKLHEDPRMGEIFASTPLDGKRMIFAGFEPILEM